MSNGVRYTLTWINSKNLIIPAEFYQRRLKPHRVNKIVATFNELVANEPKVSRRDGRFYVFDGQHTIEARKRLNNGEDVNIYCKVYEDLTAEEEALLFAIQTGTSSKPTAGERTRAKIFGRDEDATAFMTATESTGIMLDFTGSRSDEHIGCVGTALEEYHRAGEECYVEALSVIKDAWGAAEASLKMYIIKAVVEFVRVYHGRYNRSRLVRGLRKIEDPNIISNLIKVDLVNPGNKKFIKPIWDAYNAEGVIGSLPMKF